MRGDGLAASLARISHDLLAAINAGGANGAPSRSRQQWLDLIFRLVTTRTMEG
jgi:hypothetical protein